MKENNKSRQSNLRLMDISTGESGGEERVTKREHFFSWRNTGIFTLKGTTEKPAILIEGKKQNKNLT